jgi:hypothetical protein
MNPAPGYDDSLPHDLVHFVVEAELGISRGIFGQLAAGGNAGTFQIHPTATGYRDMARERRRSKRKGQALAQRSSEETAFSERAAVICEHKWRSESPTTERRARAQISQRYIEGIRANCSSAELRLLSAPTLQRVCRRLDEVSAAWTKLEVGQEVRLEWPSGRMSGAF